MMEKGIPKIINGKFLVVTVLKSGEETTTLFSIDELKEFIK